VSAVVVGGAVVTVGTGAVVDGGVGGFAGDAAVVGGTVSPVEGGTVLVVDALLARRVVDVVATVDGVEVVVVVPVVAEASDRARPKRNAPTDSVTTSTKMKSAATARSTGLRRPTAGDWPVG
jgi:hypothetical protein